MSWHRRTLLQRSAAGAAITAGSGAARAQEAWPTRSIRIVVPFAPGGSSDIAARLLAPRLGDLLGQTVVVENRGGGGGNLAAEYVARATPDGHTLLQANIGLLTVNPSLHRSLPFDVTTDFAPVSLLFSVSYALVTPNDRPWRSVTELVAAARAAPATLSCGSSGVGSMNHLASALFDHMTGTRSVHVPYRGGGPMANDVLSGKLDYAFSTLPTVLPQIEAGRVRALAMATSTRSALLPEVPTVAEAGVPGFDVPNWDSLVAPRATPPAVLARLNGVVRRALADPDVVRELGRRGMAPEGGAPEALAREIAVQTARWAPIVRATGAVND